MVMPAISSMLLMRATMAFSAASSPQPMARVVTHTTRMAMGMLAISSTTQKESTSRKELPAARR